MVDDLVVPVEEPEDAWHGDPHGDHHDPDGDAHVDHEPEVEVDWRSATVREIFGPDAPASEAAHVTLEEPEPESVPEPEPAQEPDWGEGFVASGPRK